MPTETDVLIIGAGPVGVTLACELKRHGADVRIVDQKPEPNQHPNAAVVHVRTLEFLAAMGAVGGFLQEGYALPGMQIYLSGKHAGLINVAGVDSPYPQPRTLPQQITERLLREHLARLGGAIERPVEATSVLQEPAGVTVRLKHLAEGGREEIARARWVVGCEGSASVTREDLKIEFPGERYPGKVFLQADANVRWTYPHGYGYQFMTGDAIVMLFPYDAAGHYRIIVARNDDNPDNHEPPTLEEVQELVRLVDPSAELYDPVWFNRFRSGHRLATHFREGRAFLAGDAGHVHIPIGGQGMNYGMHDAFNLGWKLAAVAKGEARPSLLDTYQPERHGADSGLIKGTDFGFQMMVKPNAVTKAARELILPTLIHTEMFQNRVRDVLGEVNVAYPDSPLTEDHAGSSGPSAGYRAPDAVLVKMPERKTTTLFEAIHGTRWTLLLFAGLDPDDADIEALERISSPIAARFGKSVAIHLILAGEPPVPVHENWAAGVLMDRAQSAHQKYGVESAPCLYLIRPDWYIGFRGGLDAAKRLASYLERVLI